MEGVFFIFFINSIFVSFGKFEVDFVRYPDTGRYLHNVSGHRITNICYKLCTKIS